MLLPRSDRVSENVLAMPDYRRQKRRAITVYMLSLCLMIVVFGWLLRGQYKQEVNAAESRAMAGASVVSEWVKGVFEQSGQGLFSLSELLKIHQTTHLESSQPDSERTSVIQRVVENLTEYVSLIDKVSILDSQGQVWVSSDGNHHVEVNLRDTVFFRTLEQGERAEMMTPLLGSATSERFYLYHGQRLENDNGDFIGVVMSRIMPHVLAEALQQMRGYEGESIALIDENLKVIARHSTPYQEITIGSQIDAPDTQQWLDTGSLSRTLTTLSPLDGRNRLFHMQRINEYPVFVVVGIDLHTLMTGWRQRLLVLLLVVGLIALLGAWGVRHYLNRLALAYQLHERIKEREQARADAQAREARMDALVHSIQDLIFVFDVEGRFSYIHAIAPEQLLTDSQDVLGKHYSQVLPAPLANAFTAVFERVQQFHQVVRFEYPLTLNAQLRHFHATVSPLISSEGQFEGVLSVNRDITEAKRAEVELQIAAAAFQAHLGILVADARGNILKVNDTFKRITGYSDAEVIGKNPRMFSSGHHNAAFYRRLWKRVMATGSWEGEIWNQRKNGELFPEWLTISAVYDASDVLTHYVATMSDISERKAAEQEIHQLAFYDPLTGFANRRLFMDRMEAALKELNRHQRCGALLVIDIDRFNHINDILGHLAGDQLLQGIAQRFGKMLRDTDTLARLGSDEFAVLVEGIDGSPRQSRSLAEKIAQKLLTALDEPVSCADEQVMVTASVGITIMSDGLRSAEDYLQQVDMALLQAKVRGRSTICFFDPAMQAALLVRVKLEADLRQALENHQWQLYYQPQVDCFGHFTGVEALLRWRHPERGMVSPEEFIPLLESTGLINEVGEWVIDAACRQLALWATKPQLRELTISVNISPLQFRDSDFLVRLQKIFSRTKAPLERLKLEVTETLFVEARDAARDKILSLKAQGVRFSLDDFGTGYSSLAYLAQLPLDQLKIDQSFVQQVLDSSANAAIVESTIALAKSLHLDVIAEGVETENQKAWLLAHGCHAFQGYLFGRPMPVGEIEAALLAQCS
ncbi:bifunctional diguanylate cyclase/phosphodiesterase [Vreelandella zhaodongensis]|uniref:bifunctional diguanylate cyclase/phosphodiesterase n=1 Tax=Vreelandella zhaodongensis TaxID=1176240 RepID=UPI003EBF73B1